MTAAERRKRTREIAQYYGFRIRRRPMWYRGRMVPAMMILGEVMRAFSAIRDETGELLDALDVSIDECVDERWDRHTVAAALVEFEQSNLIECWYERAAS